MRHRASRLGFLLVSVSWIVLILSLILLSQLRRAEMGFTGLRHARADLQLRQAARSAVNMVLAAMQQDLSEAENESDAFSDAWGWPSIEAAHGEDLARDFPDIELTVAIEHEGGKAHPEQMERAALVLEAAGRTELAAESMAQALAERLNTAREAMAPSDGTGEDNPTDNLDMRLFQGVARLDEADIFGEDLNFNGALDTNENDRAESLPLDDGNGVLRVGLNRLLTFRQAEMVNPNLAPLEILMGVPGVSRAIAEEIVRKRRGSDGREGTPDDYVFGDIEDLRGLAAVSRFRAFEYNKMAPHMAVTSHCFMVRVCAENAKTGQMARIQTCVLRDPEKATLDIQDWLEDSGV